MAKLTFGVAIVTYNGWKRVAALLKSIQTELAWVDQLLVSEDPVPYPDVRPGLIDVCKGYRAQLLLSDEWGCMQGNATRAMGEMDTDIVAILSDDVLVAPGCLKDMRDFWVKYSVFPVGAACFSSWGNWSDIQKMGYIPHENGYYTSHMPGGFYDSWPDWICKIPPNPFWFNGGHPRMYINVHGSGFALRRDVYDYVGGFAKETWCYDEDIAAKIWLKTPCVVAVAPGRPLIHYGAASQCGTEHPECTFHTNEAWEAAWGGKTKVQMDGEMRAVIAQRAYIDQMFAEVG